jgi:hypothetical protein
MTRLVDGVPVQTHAPEPPLPTAALPEVATNSRPEFRELLESVSHAIDGGEALVGRAEQAAYAPMDPGTLIALQAGIYRYSEAVDLTAKTVDRATSAVRTVLQAGH